MHPDLITRPSTYAALAVLATMIVLSIVAALLPESWRASLLHALLSLVG
jgi:hypothetical protein